MKKFLSAYLNIIAQNIDIQQDDSNIKFTGWNFNKTFKFQLRQWILDYLKNKDYVYDNTFRFCAGKFFVISPAYTNNPNQFKISWVREDYQDGHLNWHPIKSFGL